MITLGALLVGLLLLLMLLGVLAWMQRRPPRGPGQPRTVADLVRMREAAKPQTVPAGDDPGPDVVDREPTPADVESVPEPAEAPPHVTVSRAELPSADEQATTTEPAMRAALSTPEDAAVDTPWAGAARMAEPWMEWSAESDEPEPSTDTPARPSIALLPTYPTVRPQTSPVTLPEPAPVGPPLRPVAAPLPRPRLCSPSLRRSRHHCGRWRLRQRLSRPMRFSRRRWWSPRRVLSRPSRSQLRR